MCKEAKDESLEAVGYRSGFCNETHKQGVDMIESVSSNINPFSVNFISTETLSEFSTSYFRVELNLKCANQAKDGVPSSMTRFLYLVKSIIVNVSSIQPLLSC